MKKHHFRLFLLFACVLAVGCSSAPEVSPTVTAVDSVNTASLEQESQRLVDSREKIAYASPDSLRDVIESLKSTDAGKSELGIELIFIASKLLDIVYPFSWQPSDPVLTPPSGIYPELFNAITDGIYPSVQQEYASYFTLVIPPLAMLYAQSEAISDLSEESLSQALALNPESVLALYLMGFLAEQRSELPLAEEYYDKAVELAMSCYPAHIGKARILIQADNPSSALTILEPLGDALPKNIEILELTADAQFKLGNYQVASSKAADALRIDPENLNLLLIRAQVLEIQGNSEQAQRFLSLVEAKRPNDRAVILLKSEILLNKGSYLLAQSSLQHGLELFPDDTSLSEMYGRLLLETGSSREGREYLEATLIKEPGKISSLELLLKDAEERGDNVLSLTYALRLIAVEGKETYIISAYRASAGVGDWVSAKNHAETLFSRNSDDLTYRSYFARALIMTESSDQASEILDQSLEGDADITDRKIVSEMRYLRSMTRQTRDGELEDLQASLLDDLRNLESLLAISQLYEGEKDFKKAYRYLKQAAAIAPSDEITQKLEALEGSI